MSGLRRPVTLAVILLAVATIPARATYAPAPDFNRQLTAEVHAGIVVMNREAGTVGLIPNVGLAGNARAFCLLLPTPTVPTLEPMGQPIWWNILNLTQPESVRQTDRSYGCGETWEPPVGMPVYNDDVWGILGLTVGPFTAEVLDAPNVSALADWLMAHRFTIAIQDLNRFAPYLERGWVVTAMTLDTTRVKLATYLSINVAPIQFTFEASEWELPLPILAVGRDSRLPVAYFVVDDHRMTLPGFTTTYANALNESEVRAIVESHPDLASVLSAGRFLTRLDRTFGYADSLNASIFLARAEDDSEYRRGYATSSWLGGWPAMLLALGGLLLFARRRLRMRMVLWLALAPLLVSCEHSKSEILDPGTLPGEVTAEEYAVYRDLLGSWFTGDGPGRVVIQDSTVTAYGGGLWPGAIDHLLENMPALEAATFISLLGRGEAAAHFEDRFVLGLPTTLLTDQEWNEIFSAGGWNEFYRRYPDAHGLTELSRVGINPAGGQALVYIGTMYHPLAGAGYMVLLERADGVWTRTDSVMMWISKPGGDDADESGGDDGGGGTQ